MVAAGYSSATFTGGISQFAVVRYIGTGDAPEMIVALINKLRAMLNLPALAEPAAAHLQTALGSLVERKPTLACNALNRFIAVVGRVPGQALSPVQKQELIADANAIRTKIGC